MNVLENLMMSLSIYFGCFPSGSLIRWDLLWWKLVNVCCQGEDASVLLNISKSIGERADGGDYWIWKKSFIKKLKRAVLKLSGNTQRLTGNNKGEYWLDSTYFLQLFFKFHPELASEATVIIAKAKYEIEQKESTNVLQNPSIDQINSILPPTLNTESINATTMKFKETNICQLVPHRVRNSALVFSEFLSTILLCEMKHITSFYEQVSIKLSGSDSTFNLLFSFLKTFCILIDNPSASPVKKLLG